MTLHLYDPEQATNARAQGRAAWFSKDPGQKNPHESRTFYGYCWQAGWAQDVRSVEELHRDWTKESA